MLLLLLFNSMPHRRSNKGFHDLRSIFQLRFASPNNYIVADDFGIQDTRYKIQKEALHCTDNIPSPNMNM